jgi:protein-tyrosine-phosphatase
MYIPLEFIELTELVEECNKLRNVLQKVNEIANTTDESDFENQSKLIAVMCEKALKNKLPILSKKKSELMDSWEYHTESIISGEYMEQFQV